MSPLMELSWKLSKAECTVDEMVQQVKVLTFKADDMRLTASPN